MKTGGVEMFGFDWTGDGEESLINDLITLDVLGLCILIFPFMLLGELMKMNNGRESRR